MPEKTTVKATISTELFRRFRDLCREEQDISTEEGLHQLILAAVIAGKVDPETLQGTIRSRKVDK